MVTKLVESNSADRRNLTSLHEEVSGLLTSAYMKASEMIMYCDDAAVADYENCAEKILECKYNLKDLQHRI